MIKFLKKYWDNLVSALDQPLVLNKSMQVKSKGKKRFKKVKRLKIRS